MASPALAAHHDTLDARTRLRANRLGLWIFIASESFLFAAVISARFYLLGVERPEHLNQELALFITGILLLSSVSAYRAENAIAHDDRAAFFRNMSATLFFGLLFMVGVYFEYHEAMEFFPPQTLYGSVFFLIIGLHAFHVLTGMLALAVVMYMAGNGRFGRDDYWGVEATVKYWHFVDVAWVFIYPALYLVSWD